MSKVSVVFQVQNTDKLEKTISSIKEKEDVAAALRYIFIYHDQSILENEQFKGICERVNPSLLYFPVDCDENIIRYLKAAAQDDYLTFSKEGAIYSQGYFEKAVKELQKENTDVVISALKCKVTYSAMILEHNSYVEALRAGKKPGFSTHNAYYCYMYKKDMVVWPEQAYGSDFTARILGINLTTLIENRVAALDTECYVTFAQMAEAFNDWNYLFKGKEGIMAAYGLLIRPIEQAVQGIIADKPEAKDMADYALFNYYRTLNNRIGKNQENYEGVFYDEIKERTDSFFGAMTNPDIIAECDSFSPIYRNYILKKYLKDKIDLSKKSHRMSVLAEFYEVELMVMQEKGDKLCIDFTVNTPYGEKCELYISWNDDKQRLFNDIDFRETYFGRELICKSYLYKVEIPKAEMKDRICFIIKAEAGEYKLANFTYRGAVPFSDKARFFIRLDDKLLFESEDSSEIVVKPYSAGLKKKLEIARDKSIASNGVPGLKALAARAAYARRKKQLEKEGKQVWLVSDRTGKADDNGEAFMEFLVKRNDARIKPYFVIEKKSPDYSRMKQLGEIIEPMSKEHKLQFLLCEYSISSQANKAVVNPFGNLGSLYKDIIYNKKIAFLQHGVTKDDISDWLNKYNRLLYGFVVSTKPEYDSIFEYNYYHDAENVWLTGFPRYDKLYHDEKKYITVMPTWRKSLSDGTDENGVWIVGKAFEESTYLKFFNNLLNHERLLSACEEMGYTLCFMPHPNTVPGMKFFKQDSRVRFMNASDTYRDVFASTDLMITDYSSVAFDFAYLRKPILYAQFDRDEFFSGGHSYTEGYYNYETDGFGEVETELEAVVDRCIEYMKNGCALKDEYRARIDSTFAFNDKNCSERVYEHLVK